MLGLEHVGEILGIGDAEVDGVIAAHLGQQRTRATELQAKSQLFTWSRSSNLRHRHFQVLNTMNHESYHSFYLILLLCMM